MAMVFDMFLNGVGKQMNDTTLKVVTGIKGAHSMQVDGAYSPPKQCIITIETYFRTDNLLIHARRQGAAGYS